VVRVNDRGPYARDRILDVSVKTAELLGFYGHGVTRVRVEYVGRAPIEGSDDRKLIATLREGNQAIAPIQVTSSRPFAPASFDSRSTRNFDASGIPSPPDRPYRLGEDARDPSVVPAPTTELAAATRPRISAPAVPYRSGESVASPVSGYVPTRYDSASGFMNGRGLY
jgi:rare lipoprotein A